ncbi:MAG: adenosine kinase [Desulfobacteraceae bacterium]|nr:MAG: adenosine kinase [Desulfobacteraceae bacterium]
MTIFDKLDTNRNQVTGVGSALIDILAREEDAFLQRVGAIKGGMTYVDKTFIDQTLGMMSAAPQVVPGGSACNTVVGIGRLGGKARFVGKCGRGPMGRLFRTDLEKQGVESLLFTSDEPTGRVLSIITPDAQRSMFTFLGASAQTRPEEITPGCFADAAIVHIEGYLLFNRELIIAAFEAARQAGALVSLDLASFNVVAEARDILPELIAEYVDILLANEDEAFVYTGIRNNHESVLALSENVQIAALKAGSRGSLIAHDGQILTVQAKGNGRAVDTTGAGDLWASGFLYGLVHRMPLPLCAELASLCGYEVCQVIGANIPQERWQTILAFTETQWPKNEFLAKS